MEGSRVGTEDFSVNYMKHEIKRGNLGNKALRNFGIKPALIQLEHKGAPRNDRKMFS